MQNIKVSKLYKESCSPLPEMFCGPKIETLEYKIYSDLESGYTALKNGNIDLLDWPINSDEKPNSGFIIHPCRVFGYYYLGLNTRSNPTKWKSMRKALAYLFNYVKGVVAADLKCDHVEMMDGLLAKSLYGRLVNPYVCTYETKDAEDALAKACESLSDFVIGNDKIIDPLGVEIAPNSIICLILEDDYIARDLMMIFKAILENSPKLKQIFSFRSCDRNTLASQIYSETSDWHLFVGFNYIQDGLARWNPGMNKLRTSVDWLGDYMSSNNYIRNFVGFKNESYDIYAKHFLKTMEPHDLRPALITEDHLDSSWNNPEFWINGGTVPTDSSALLLVWKLQWMLSDELPVVPLFIPSANFVSRTNIRGIWNGYPDDKKTYPGGIINYWTFQRIRKQEKTGGKITLGITKQLCDLNPLTSYSYWEAVIWGRIYEPLLALNPFLLMDGIAEDTCNLASSFSSGLVDNDRIKQRLCFGLRKNILWHDGTQFDSYDVAFTFLSLFGDKGRVIARRHPSTEKLIELLVNEKPIPGWIDLVKSLHHIEISDRFSIDLFLTDQSRYAHEWFGDVPILPMHVWRFLGSDFTNPVYNGTHGLLNIVDHSRIQPKGDFTGWNGLVGTGPFVWITPENFDGIYEGNPLTKGWCLKAFNAYHYNLDQSLDISEGMSNIINEERRLELWPA